MKREPMLPRFFSMILLAMLISVTLISCSSPKDGNQLDAEGTSTQMDSESGADPSGTKGITVGGLDFNSTSADVKNKLGAPLETDSAPDISVYYYGEDQYKGNTIYFIGDKVCAFIIGEGGLSAPKDIKIGDNIVKALREYYIPEELEKLGISNEDTDGEMLQKIIDRNKCVVFFNDYENSRISVSFAIPDGSIDRISIIKVNAKSGPVRIEASDFNASAEEIADKFGYPDEITIYNKYAYEFRYTDTSANIMFLKDSSARANSFSYRNEWLMPYDVRVGDKIHEVFQALYLPDDIKNLGISLSMNHSEIAEILNENHAGYFHFDLLSDYSITVGIDESGIVYYASIAKFNDPQYPAARADSAFSIPAFDPETIATTADLYLSGCNFSSTRQEVFQILGSPIKTEEGYGEYVDKYQDCYYENAVVYFLNVGDYEDLNSGEAWYYYITDPSVIGPRGLRVGDNIEKVLEVFPGTNDFDFKTIIDDTSLYSNPDDPNDETNSATVYPADYQANAGEVYLNVDWVYGITFKYEYGIITGITLSEMLD